MDQILILGALVALGLSWWRLGSVLGPFWDRLERLLGPNLGPNMEPTWAKNRSKKSIIFWMPLGIDVFMDFGGFWVPKWSQVGTKMGSNIDFAENTKKRIWN